MNINKQLLDVNQYSRPGEKIGKIKNVVVHWVGNPGSTAIANRNYFNSLKYSQKTFASAHYIVGLDGEIVQCVPENEVAYHAKQANSYSIGVEVCHKDWGGEFTGATYKSLIMLLGDICARYKLNPTTAIIRHYDVTKKDCPHYYVANQKAWQKLISDVVHGSADDGVNDELKQAVHKLVVGGVSINESAWDHVDKINIKYVPALLEKLGGLTRLQNDGVITSPDVWLNGKYTAQHVASLLIKCGAHV